jgi:hypothetical protein
MLTAKEHTCSLTDKRAAYMYTVAGAYSSTVRHNSFRLSTLLESAAAKPRDSEHDDDGPPTLPATATCR